jgi:hypothetical protein
MLIIATLPAELESEIPTLKLLDSKEGRVCCKIALN